MKYFFTKYKFFLSGAALILTAASCTSTLSDEPATDARAISFTPAAETRAAVEEDFPDDSSFSVWGWYVTDSQITNNVFDGETVTKSDGAWTYTGGTQYWISGMTYNFYGVYPANVGSCEADGTITVTNFDCSATGENAVDLMTATAPGLLGDAAPTVAMPFQHELAKVKIVVKAEQGVSATINNATLYGMDIQGTLSGGSWTGLETPVGTTDTPFKLSGSKTVDSQTPEADLFGTLLLIPQGCQELKLDIAITRYGEQQETQTISLGTSIAQWAAAQSYRYVLTIKANAITFGDFTVEEWGLTNTGGNINIGKQ